VTAIDWRSHTTPPMRAVTALMGYTKAHTYMITRSRDGRILLCRWRAARPTHLEDLREAVTTTIEVSGHEQGQQIAQDYEDGTDTPWADAWRVTAVRPKEVDDIAKVNELRVVAAALIGSEREALMDDYAYPGSAEITDILDEAYQRDLFLGEREAFLDEHGAAVPGGMRTAYACLALRMTGQELTVKNVRRLLGAAGLLDEDKDGR